MYSAGDAEHRHRTDDLDRFRRCGGATKDKTVVTDQKEEKKAEEKKTEEKVQTETNEELIKTRTERDIFKKLYEQMTGKAVRKARNEQNTDCTWQQGKYTTLKTKEKEEY